MHRKIIVAFLSLLTLSCEDKLQWIETSEDEPHHVVSGISPESGTAGTIVVITGSNFSADPSGNSVTINGTSAEIIESSSTRITFIAPAETTGPVVVIVDGDAALNKPVFIYQ